MEGDVFLPRRTDLYAAMALGGIFGPDLFQRQRSEILQYQLTTFALTDRHFRRRVMRYTPNSGAKP